jgi:hypothetical protein
MIGEKRMCHEIVNIKPYSLIDSGFTHCDSSSAIWKLSQNQKFNDTKNVGHGL